MLVKSVLRWCLHCVAALPSNYTYRSIRVLYSLWRLAIPEDSANGKYLQSVAMLLSAKLEPISMRTSTYFRLSLLYEVTVVLSP